MFSFSLADTKQNRMRGVEGSLLLVRKGDAAMSLATHELARLKTLLASVSGTAHASTALKLAKQFERPLGETEARIYDEALLHLARAEKTEARTRLSRRLAPVEIGPARTVADLAYDLDPEVAAPVLRLSVLLQDADLITIAQTRSQ